MSKRHQTYAHTHPCDICKEPVECDGTHEHNPDGWPVAWCLTYHERGEPDGSWLCDDCREKSDAQDVADALEHV